MSQMMPPGLAEMLQGAGGGPPGGGAPPDLASILGGGGGAPPEAEDGGLGPLQEIIQMLPAVMSSLPDARDTQDVAKCLQILTGIQTRLMQGAQRGAGPQAAGY